MSLRLVKQNKQLRTQITMDKDREWLIHADSTTTTEFLCFETLTLFCWEYRSWAANGFEFLFTFLGIFTCFIVVSPSCFFLFLFCLLLGFRVLSYYRVGSRNLLLVWRRKMCLGSARIDKSPRGPRWWSFGNSSSSLCGNSSSSFPLSI